MKRKPKRKPLKAELGSYQETVSHRGVKYEQTVFDKMGEDGVMESHMNYTPHMRPKGIKSRLNFTVGKCLPTCKCVYHKRKK